MDQMRLALPQPVEWGPSRPFTPIRLGWITSAIRQHWKLVAGALAVCILLALLYVSLTPTSYSATAVVTLEQRQREVVEGGQVLSDLPVSLGGVADTQVEVLRSRAIALGAAQRLGVERAKKLLNADDPRRARSNEVVLGAAADVISRSILVVRLGMSFAISITARAGDPEMAADMANAVAEAYLAGQLREKNGATEDAAAYLGTQIEQMRGEVRQAEQAVSSYQAANGLLTVTRGDLTEQRMSEFQRQEADAQAIYSEKSARLGAARSQLAGGAVGDGSIGEGQNSGVVRDLRAKLADVVQKQSEARVRYGPKHPLVAQLDEERGSLEGDLRRETSRIIEGLSADAAAARGRLDSVSGSVGEARASLARENSASVALAELNREADAKRSLYKSYLARYQQLMSVRGQAVSDARLASSAAIPLAPEAPRKSMAYALALVVGLLLGLALAAIAEVLEHRVRSSDDITHGLQARYLGYTPQVEGSRSVDTAALIDELPNSHYTESFRTLHLAIGTMGQSEPPGVVAVTSALADEGKTSTSLALARSAVRSGKTALVIDCDTRRRGFTKLMSMIPQAGMVEVAEGSVPLADAVLRDAGSGCDFIAAAAPGRKITEDIDNSAVERILAELRPAYDLIILDCGPVLAVAEAQARVALADGVLLLARWRSTPMAALRSALAVLKQQKIGNVGVIITMIPPGTAEAGNASYYYKQLAQYYAS